MSSFQEKFKGRIIQMPKQRIASIERSSAQEQRKNNIYQSVQQLQMQDNELSLDYKHKQVRQQRIPPKIQKANDQQQYVPSFMEEKNMKKDSKLLTPQLKLNSKKQQQQTNQTDNMQIQSKALSIPDQQTKKDQMSVLEKEILELDQLLNAKRSNPRMNSANLKQVQKPIHQKKMQLFQTADQVNKNNGMMNLYQKRQQQQPQQLQQPLSEQSLVQHKPLKEESNLFPKQKQINYYDDAEIQKFSDQHYKFLNQIQY